MRFARGERAPTSKLQNHRAHQHLRRCPTYLATSRQLPAVAEVYFEITGTIEDIETIAVGGNIRDSRRLREQYGSGRWRKLKGTAIVTLQNGHIRRAEIHWYEAHGIGKRKMKIKRFLD